jgi:uncharacterized membrane protein (DUF4010 family)
MRRRASPLYSCRMTPPGSPSVDALLPGLALALAIGLLVGVERGWQQREGKAGSRVAGIRTFAILGLLGGLAGTQLAGPAMPLAITLLAGAIAALLLGYGLDPRRSLNVSATSALAGIVTLGLGTLATTGQMALASIGAGATVILLAARQPLHRAIRATSAADIRALLRLVLVVFVILPLLPDRGMGPFDALNPRRLWLVVVVTSGIAFVGYALARWLGEKRGVLLSAAVGALVSSTAVTVDSGRRIRAGSAGPADNAAVAVASAIMFARGLLLTAVLAPLAFGRVAALVLPAAIVALFAAAVLLWRARAHPDSVALREARPPGLGLALLFAASVAIISILTAWAQTRFGGESGAVVIALGGTADIDAAIAAVGALRPGSLPVELAALAIAAPILYNSFFKSVVLLVVARSRRALPGAVALGAAALALAVPIAIALF